jgi:DNA (cytosine-5)-methyltransferase 1
MKVLSLFSGVGGFDLGLEAAGMETVFQCEWDKHATSILERHWPDVPRWGDITTLTGKHILAHAPVIDVVAWGSPCQDLSVAGKRAGLEGLRSGLFHEGIRIIKELRKETNNVYPRISLWENVYGALNSNRGADFGVILNEMAEAGSLVQEWRVLDAQYFGVPQRRRRVFLISVFDTATAARCPDPLLPVSEGVQWHPATSNQARQESTGTTPEGTTSRGLRMRSFGDYADDDTASAIKARDYKDATDLVVGKNYARPVGTAVLGSEIIGSLNAVDYKWPQNQQLDENKFIVVDEKPILIDRGAFNQGQNALYKPIISDDPVIPSLVARGPHAVATFTPTLSFDTQFGSNANVFENQSPTLKASQAAPSVAIPIHDQATRHSGKRGTKSDGKGNGFGIGNEGDPMNTLTSGDRHAVAYTLREREGKPGGGKGPLVTPEKSGTLAARSNDQTVFQPQALAYDEYNDTIGGEVHHALRAGTKQSTGVVIDESVVAPSLTASNDPSRSPQSAEITQQVTAIHQATMAVRRLTPLECERLMGWPDGWTATKADGTPQSDTHRYKQCGNGIASPVAQWIAQQLLQLDKEPDAPPTTTTT